MMGKFEMQDYLRDKFDEIIQNHLVIVENVICGDDKDLEDIAEFIDDIRFYKAWNESGGYKATIFLEEVDDDKEWT